MSKPIVRTTRTQAYAQAHESESTHKTRICMCAKRTKLYIAIVWVYDICRLQTTDYREQTTDYI